MLKLISISILFFLSCKKEEIKLPTQNGVKLNFATATETNSDYFVIRHSDSTYFFKILTTIKAAGNSTSPQRYSYIDNHPYNGVNYYCLEEVDTDGREYKLGTISINNK